MVSIMLQALTIFLLCTFVPTQSILLGHYARALGKSIINEHVKRFSTAFHIRRHCQKDRAYTENEYQECILAMEACDAPGIFEVEKDASLFYVCTLNERAGKFIKEIGECYAGTVYDWRSMQCLNLEQMLISKRIYQPQNESHISCPKYGIFGDVEDCKVYYTCNGYRSQAQKYYCTPGTYFNENSNQCVEFMTKRCLSKLQRLNNLKRNNARNHYKTILEIYDNKPNEIEQGPTDYEKFENNKDERGKGSPENQSSGGKDGDLSIPVGNEELEKVPSVNEIPQASFIKKELPDSQHQEPAEKQSETENRGNCPLPFLFKLSFKSLGEILIMIDSYKRGIESERDLRELYCVLIRENNKNRREYSTEEDDKKAEELEQIITLTEFILEQLSKTLNYSLPPCDDERKKPQTKIESQQDLFSPSHL